MSRIIRFIYENHEMDVFLYLCKFKNEINDSENIEILSLVSLKHIIKENNLFIKRF